MIIDSHLHLARKENFDKATHDSLKMNIPENTEIDQLVSWLKAAGVFNAVVMGQDMTRIWNTSFGEDYVCAVFERFPDFFIPFASAEPLDKANRFNINALNYVKKAVVEYGFKGILLTPPYGQYMSNDKAVYPFYEFAQDKGVVIQYHHSAQMGPAILAPLKYTNMFNLNDVIIDFPDLKIVVEHIGYPWSENLFVLMGNSKNLYTDLAMTFKRPTWLTWNLVLAKEYGVIDRVMYASDYVAANFDLVSADPVKDFIAWTDFIRYDLNKRCRNSGWPEFTQDEIDGILWKNAARLYEIHVNI
jgi:predicted TIM-barrel fold metal-dependent hydrolase